MALLSGSWRHVDRFPPSCENGARNARGGRSAAHRCGRIAAGRNYPIYLCASPLVWRVQGNCYGRANGTAAPAAEHRHSLPHPVLHAATPFGENVVGLGADTASFTLHTRTSSLLLLHAPLTNFDCARACLTGGRSTVCAGRCVHRAGQCLQRHDLLLHAGLLLLCSNIEKAFANPDSHTHTRTHARAHTSHRSRTTRRHASIPPTHTPHA